MSNSQIVVCTLYEGSFEVGVAALVNSLYDSGFRGDIAVGYRGSLPQWAKGSAETNMPYYDVKLVDGLRVRFTQLDTDVHFTVYKPVFMLKVLDQYPDALTVAYFDPDIVIKAKWWFYRDWFQCGVALVEDINSPFSLTHPKRFAWKRLAQEAGHEYSPKESIYVNGGFVGLLRTHATFLHIWAQMIEQVRIINPKVDSIGMHIDADRNYYFRIPDQDCLNITMGIYGNYSVIEKQAMDFASGGYVMSHSTGKDKPWQRSFLRYAFLKGLPPRLADKEFWRHTTYPIPIFDHKVTRRKVRVMKAASLISRLVGK